MKKLQIFSVLLLSFLLISSTAAEKENKEISKCPYLTMIHSYGTVESDKSECPYLSNRNKSKAECPYLKNEKMSESKESGVCPYSGKSKSIDKVKKEIKNYQKIELDKS